MNWSEVTARVVVEACAAHPEDMVVDLGCGDGSLARELAPRVKQVIGVDRQRDAGWAGAPANVRFVQEDLRQFTLPPGTSVVLLHDVVRLLSKRERAALITRLGRQMQQRALLVIGDVMWSMPRDMVDEPEQYGSPLGEPPTTKEIEAEVRAAGFLPDLHRFGVGRAVIIALKGGDK